MDVGGASGTLLLWVVVGLAGLVACLFAAAVWLFFLQRSLARQLSQREYESAPSRPSAVEQRSSTERTRMFDAIRRTGDWDYKIQTNQFSASEQIRRIFGFAPDQKDITLEALESRFVERERFHTSLMDLIEGGVPFSLEFEMRPVNQDESKILAIVAELQREEDGRPLRVLGVIQDVTDRWKAEKALRESEERFAAAFHASPGLMAITRMADGKILEVNEGYSQMLGYSREESRDRTTASLAIWANPRDREIFTSTLQTNGQVSNFETTLRRKDGQLIEVVDFARKIAIGGEPCVLSVAYDLTEIRRAENALRRERSVLARLMETSPIGITLLDRDGQIIFANARAQDILGLSRPDILQRSFNAPQWQITDSEGGPFPEEELPFVRVMTTGQPVRDVQHGITWPDGRRVLLSINGAPLFDESGGIESVVCTIEDITERRRAERALSESNQHFRSMVETLPLAIYLTTGIEQKCEYLNPAFVSLFGYAIEDVPAVARWWSLAYPDDDYRAKVETEWMKRVQVAIETQSAIEPMEVVVTCKDARKKNILWGYIALGEKGYAYGLDLTDSRQSEEQIRRLTQELEMRVAERTAQLEASNQELEAFAYSISHDLRIPLRAIDGYRALLEKRIADSLDDEARRYLNTISRGAIRMGRLIDDLLAYTSMGRSRLTARQVDMAALVQDVVAELAPKQIGRDVRWHIEHLPGVTGDPAMLRLAVLNLIANALKFTSTRQQAEITIGFRQEATETVFFVRDNGVGFDMQFVAKLFGVFQRLHGIDEFEGTGMGLANVRRIIERHGGRAWAEGKVNEGATFFFTIPRSHPNAMP